MPYCDYKRFQGIYQICANCCIPASIENVVRYLGGKFSQRKFLDDFLGKYHMNDLSFENIKKFLDNYSTFNIYFKCECKTKKEHIDKDNLLVYIKECLKEDLPVMIVLKESENNKEYIHIVTVYYLEDNNISYFDSNPTNGGFVEFIDKNNFINKVSDNLGTLILRKRNRE